MKRLLAIVFVLSVFSASAWAITRHSNVLHRDMLEIDVRWYGAKCDGVTDDTSAIQSAFNAVATSGAELSVIRMVGNCLISGNPALTISQGFVLKDACFTYSGSGTAVLIDSSSTVDRMRVDGLRIYRYGHSTTGIASECLLGIGLAVKRVQQSVFNNVKVNGFQYGIYLNGDGAGCSYNHFYNPILANNYHNIHIERGGATAGYTQENVFSGGRCVFSGTFSNASGTCHIYHGPRGSVGGTTLSVAGIRYYDMSLEGTPASGGGSEAPDYKIYEPGGFLNLWQGCRFEHAWAGGGTTHTDIYIGSLTRGDIFTNNNQLSSNKIEDNSDYDPTFTFGYKNILIDNYKGFGINTLSPESSSMLDLRDQTLGISEYYFSRMGENEAGDVIRFNYRFPNSTSTWETGGQITWVVNATSPLQVTPSIRATDPAGEVREKISFTPDGIVQITQGTFSSAADNRGTIRLFTYCGELAAGGHVELPNGVGKLSLVAQVSSVDDQLFYDGMVNYYGFSTTISSSPLVIESSSPGSISSSSAKIVLLEGTTLGEHLNIYNTAEATLTMRIEFWY